MPADGMAAPGFVGFLRAELAPRPGRLAAVARIAGCCTVVVAIAMLYQVPLPAYMAYAVFLVSRGEAASTLLTGIVAGVAFTIAIVLSLVFYALDASEPALRIPLIALSTFTAMFMVRTMPLGPVAFLAGFVLVLSQTLIDRFPNLEALTRLVLWLWVVVMVPIMVTVLVNLLIGENPSRLARRKALKLLRAAAAAFGDDMPGIMAPHRDAAMALVEIRQRAQMFDHGLSARAAIDSKLIETLAELTALFALLPTGLPADTRGSLAAACEACAQALERGTMPSVPPPATTASLSAAERPVVLAMIAVLDRLADGLAQRRSAVAPPVSVPAKVLFVADAFSNPDHVRYALKTTIAVMAAYIIYSGLDWPGISTSVTTCFFVALGSLGETMHKLTLRLGGALVGGLAGALSIVYLLPQMTDIGQLCLLVAIVAAACAWVSTASDLLAYGGMQAAFAFFMGVLQDYGPSTDLTVLRDRIAGILLGNILMSVVFSVLWSTSATDRARAATARALRSLAVLLTADGAAKPASRLAVLKSLADARRFVGLAAFELRLLPARSRDEALGGISLHALERVAAASMVVVEQAPGPKQWDDAVSAWLTAWADRLGMPAASEPPPVPASGDPTNEARACLQMEIDDAVAARI